MAPSPRARSSCPMPVPRRLTLMMLLAAGLYLGPFLAGLARHPAATVLVFGAMLAVWSIIYRSASWPRRVGELASPVVLVRTLLLACVMLGLAGIFFLAGT